MVGQANTTMSQLTSNIAASATNSSDNVIAQPSFAWIINDNTDLLQVGYGGSLTLQSLTLLLPEPCCVMVSLIGSWFFSDQPLPWNVFGTILPGAFSVQAVRVPQLHVPAYFTMRNVSIMYTSCGADFAAAAQLLVSQAHADLDDSGGNVISFDADRNALYCQTCIFQGSQQVPSRYSNAVSIVSLYDTHITCLPESFSDASAHNTTASAPVQSAVGKQPPTLQSSAAGWAPPIWLPVLLAIVTSGLVLLGVFAVWRRLHAGFPKVHLPSCETRRFPVWQSNERTDFPGVIPLLFCFNMSLCPKNVQTRYRN